MHFYIMKNEIETMKNLFQRRKSIQIIILIKLLKGRALLRRWVYLRRETLFFLFPEIILIF